MNVHQIFSQFEMSPDELGLLEGSFELTTYEPGEYIIEQGQEADSFYCLSRGVIAVLSEDSKDADKTIDLGNPGCFFGEIGILHNIRRTASVKALTPVQVYRATRQAFLELLEINTSFASFIQQLSVARLLQQVPNFSRLDLLQRNQIRELLTRESVRKGEILCARGRKADRLYLISSGGARRAETGEPLLAGDYAGAAGFFEGTSYPEEVVMQEDGEVFVLHRADLVDLTNRKPMAIEPPLKKGLINTLAPFFTGRSAYAIIPEVSMNHPRRVLWVMLLSTFLLLMMATFPSVWPEQFPWLNAVEVDTDPENMLSADDPARVIHNDLKAQMDLYDLMVVGVVNKTHPDGIYNPQSLSVIHQLAEFAGSIRWTEDNQVKGVVDVDLMAPSTVDDIGQEGTSGIRFSWLMPEPPQDRAESLEIRKKIERLPLMDSALASRDGRAMAIYLPLTSKDVSYRVYQQLLGKIETFTGDEQIFITGLPVAEDAFGVEMFIQMAISAPVAMLVIFLLMYYFFRNLTLITAPMIIAMVSVMITMSLLVISGQTIHIMSSMIPIFIMPIAVLDSVHILSEFFDYYPRIQSRRLTLKHVVNELFVPMFYTSVTTALGFASLALVPIPPVQVFGIFVAIGVFLAWLLSISFIPAYIFLVKPGRIRALIDAREKDKTSSSGWVHRFLRQLHAFSTQRSVAITSVSLLLIASFLAGILKIEVNDNPIRWFKDSHMISVADRELNSHFAGTYMAYLAFTSKEQDMGAVRKQWSGALARKAAQYQASPELLDSLQQVLAESGSQGEALARLESSLENLLEGEALPVQTEDFLYALLDWLDQQRNDYQVFKQPRMLSYLSELQRHLVRQEVIGKTVTIADFVKTINRELHEAREEYYAIPDSPAAVSQILLTYQNSHRPQDLWRFMTPDARQGVVWLMLNSGDNKDMTRVINEVRDYVVSNPPPYEVATQWFGLNYINVVWQDKMVNGMLMSIVGSYLAVMLIMVFLLRSMWWGLLAMAPLTVTLIVIYGLLGLMGKSYDMPVAVLSALTIGLAIDFSIHFSLRIRQLFSQTSDWRRALSMFFDEPARALLRNLLVVAIGFSPLLLAPLVPYNTVGNLIASILLVSGIVTLAILPAVLHLKPKVFFPRTDYRRTTSPGPREAVFSAVIALLLMLVALNPILPLQQGNWPLYLLATLLIVLRTLHVINQKPARNKPTPE